MRDRGGEWQVWPHGRGPICRYMHGRMESLALRYFKSQRMAAARLRGLAMAPVKAMNAKGMTKGGNAHRA